MALTRWLDGAQVGSNDLTVWMGVGKVQGPEPGSCAHVETQLRVLHGSLVQRPFENHAEAVTHEVEPVLLFVVVWEQVRAFLVGMVAAAVLELAFTDRRCHGCGEVRVEGVSL